MWSKIKEALGVKPLESLKDFESELIKLQEKSNCDFTALIGTGGRFKGLPLIYAAKNEDLLKKFTAKLSEIIKPLKDLSEGKIMNEFRIYYKDSILIFKPITENIDFLAITNNSDYIQYIIQYINKKLELLKSIFENK